MKPHSRKTAMPVLRTAAMTWADASGVPPRSALRLLMPSGSD
jgi:hypothetical protein